METPEIIKKLGGRQAVAELTGVGANAITQWRYKGVPPLHWHTLAKAAAERGLTGITVDSLAQTRPDHLRPAHLRSDAN